MRATRRWIRRLGWLVVVTAAGGCGSDYRPPAFETTGAPAAPLGLEMDLDVDLAQLRIPGVDLPGVRFAMSVELERDGFGDVPARYGLGTGMATWFMGSGPIEDLADGRTVVTVGPDRWVTGRIGPLRVGGATFELMLDGSVDAAATLWEGQARESQSAGMGAFTGRRRLRWLVAGSDFFSAGQVAEVRWVGGTTLQVRNGLEPISSDAVVRVAGRSLYAVNRLSFDNVQQLDPDSDYATAWQVGVGQGANPHDIVEAGDGRFYVSRYEPPFNDLAIIDESDGALLGAIDLSGLAENVDATPRADGLLRAGGVIFVALQDIDRTFTRYAEGKLAVVDPSTDAVAEPIPLGGKNPFAMQLRVGEDGRERIYVALAGILPGLLEQELSGGVVIVDVLNRAVEGWALDDDVAGGNLTGLAIVSERLGYVVASDANFRNRVLAFDPTEGAVLRTVFETSDFIPEISLAAGQVLAIPDRSFAQPRLCLFAVPSNPAVQERPLGCGALQLPPFSVEALD